MDHRIATLLDSESATTAATKTIDINLATPISRIVIQFKGTNNGHDPTAHPAKMVSKIEIVDGSDVLFSLSGIQCQALNYFNSGRMPTSILDYRNDVMAIALFNIDFGRFLWDDLLAFNPTKHTNPQLKITHDKSLGGSAPDAATMDVYAHAYDEKKIVPSGFLMSKEQYSYSLVSSAIEHIDLATDFAYRTLLIQSLAAGKQPWEQYNKLKLTENNDQKVILNTLSTSVLLKMFETYGPIVEDIFTSDHAAATTIYCTPTYNVTATALGLGSADAALFSAQSFGGTISVTGTAGKEAQWILRGTNPHGAMAIPFGIQNLIETWYKVAAIGSLKFNVTAGSSVGASSTCSILSQQLRPYV